MNERTFEGTKKIVPFAPTKDEASPEGEAVERSGQAIVSLLQQAASVAKENCDRAMDVAHKLSMQLRAAEDRIKGLEQDLRRFQERALRSEKWMGRIHKEIEEKFFDPRADRGEPARR